MAASPAGSLPRPVGWLRRFPGCAPVFFLGLFLWLSAPPALRARVEFYVSPAGNDAWSGTRPDPAPGGRDGPFATLFQAQRAVRALRKRAGEWPRDGVRVTLRAGRYRLAHSLVFSAADSGMPAARLEYRAAPGENVWLCGGVDVPPTAFRPAADPDILRRLPMVARSHVLALQLAGLGIRDYLRRLPDRFWGATHVEPLFLEVYCNGRRMPWARWPNHGFAKFGKIVDPGSGLRDYKARLAKKYRPATFRYIGDRPRRWNVDRGVWMLGFWARAYLCTAVRAGRIDPARKEITWKVPLPYGLDTWGARRWVAFNLLEELDSPGEWYLDRGKGILYFWPPAPIRNCNVMLTRLKAPLLEFDHASNITVRGIGLEGGRGDAVAIHGGQAIRLVACELRNVGRNGVQILGGHDHKVLGCDIHHVGYSGAVLRGGDRKTLDPARFEAANNHIHHTGRVKPTHTAPVIMNGVGMRLAHNLIHHAPHSAVFYGGNDLVMEYNEIYWCHYETSEGGVFYTGRNWTYAGNLIRRNYIHDINDSLEGSPTGVNVLHLDDCVSGTTFRENIVFRVGRGVALCGGPFNVIDNNLFIDCQVGVDVSDRGRIWWKWARKADGAVVARDTRASHGFTTRNPLLRSLRKVPYDRPPYSVRYPYLAGLLKVPVADLGAPLGCSVTRNISINGPVLRVSRGVKSRWVRIADNWDGPTDGDPGIVDAYAGNYALRPNAPARKIGFQPIPFREIGLIHDGVRRSWPVHPDPPPAGYEPAWLKRRNLEQQMPGGLPVVAVPHRLAAIVVDGVIRPEEWDPAAKRTVSGLRIPRLKLAWDASGNPAKTPCTAYVETGDANLYFAFDNPGPAAAGITGGRTWGKSDAVEVALAVSFGREVGPIMIWRGYTDGSFETSGEAGAPRAVVARARKGVAYGARILSKTHWSAEFRIPFTAIGIQPEKQNPRLLFALSVRAASSNQWITWKSAPGYTWEVRKSGILWLEPFGDIAFNGAVASRARCEIQAAGPNHTPLLAPGPGCQLEAWAKPRGRRLSARSGDLGPDWVPLEFTFLPKAGGKVRLELRGRAVESTLHPHTFIPVWTYWDAIRVTGATLVNGDFEHIDPRRGGPAGWTMARQALWISTPGTAAAGKHCIKTWFLGGASQVVAVKKGVPVTVHCRVRGEPTPPPAGVAAPSGPRLLDRTWYVRRDPDASGERRGWTRAAGNLNGWTRTAFDPRRRCLPAAGAWQGVFWCRKRIVLRPDQRRRRHVWLLVPAVDEECRVFANGRLVLDHTAAAAGQPPGRLWNDPFALDLKPLADPAGRVELALRVATPNPGGGLRKPPVLLAADAALTAAQLYAKAEAAGLLEPRRRDFARADIPPLPPAADAAGFGAHLRRTLALLAGSRPGHRNRVRILFYGQSIVAGMHVREIVNTLRRRFPWAVIRAENRAIGGFTAPALIRTAYHDLYPYPADLVIFHVYGGEKHGQLEGILRGIREQMTADVLVFTHQIAWNPNPAALARRTAADDASAAKMRELARKYGFELADVRKEWRQYLAVHHMPIRELIGDKVHGNVHPNVEGHTLLAQLILRHFRPPPAQVPEPDVDGVRTLRPGDPALSFTGPAWPRRNGTLVGGSKHSALRIAFTGNRLDLLLPPGAAPACGSARIVIDGKPPAAYPGLLRCTRPSVAPYVWWPAVRRVTLGDSPKIEQWTLVFRDVDVEKGRFSFELRGSKTGPDGRGSSDRPFVSNSGRIRIDPRDFTIIGALRYRHKPCPPRFQATWRVVPLYRDPWRPDPLPLPGVEQRDTVVTLLPFGRHIVDIVPLGDGPVPVRAVRTYRPPLGPKRAAAR